MWFSQDDRRALFVDSREEEHVIGKGPGKVPQSFAVRPDVVADFTALPFPDESFWHVAFDPPHLTSAGADSILAKRYGVLFPGWEEMLKAGFGECFRVLKPNGTLIFKWSAVQIPLSRVLALTSEKPLYGHRGGKNMKTHWIAFLKQTKPQ